MSYLRKQKRNQTIHKELKCKCGNKAKFYKTISFKQTNKAGVKEIKTYHNVFWCKSCGLIYELNKKEEENVQNNS